MVELKNVSFRYGAEESGSEQANSLSDLYLTVRDGEFVLLTGPSGCGKTTILRLINGLIPHFYPGTLTGSVTVDGKAVQERELYETAVQVGTVFQNPRSQFYNVDTTGELAFGCALASGRKLLLLDEPTSGLDYAHMMETAALLRQLQGLGATILVVTHDSELIRACCSRRLSFSAKQTGNASVFPVS